MEKVVAVVVTYNRKELLSECIAALRNQTRAIDLILVINNGSRDHTENWLRHQPDIEFVTQGNIGSAGGFNTGIQLAYEKGFDWIWLMDDDGFPKEDALEKLLENDNQELSLRNCAVINKEDKKSFVWKTGNYSSVDEVKEPFIKNFAHPFNGTLIHKKIIEKVGLPKKELFIWGDESEYLYRIIRKNKIPYYTNANSIHYHPASEYSYKNDWSLTTNWKMYFYVRNRFFILKSKFRNHLLITVIMYLGFIAAFAGTIIFFQKTNRLKKLGFILWPVADAFTSNFKATPSFILEKISSSPSYRPGNYFLNQARNLSNLLSPLSGYRKAKKGMISEAA